VEDADFIHLAQERVEWLTLLKITMKQLALNTINGGEYFDPMSNISLSTELLLFRITVEGL
jgi:hypothetical protein